MAVSARAQMTGLTDLLAAITADHEPSWNNFKDLRAPCQIDHPIPFFGPADEAMVLTVGVNPAWTEFRDRAWPVSMTVGQLEGRLRAYFTSAPVPRHDWFEPWEEALSEIGVCYGAAAAHLDLSPRATRAMRSCPADRFLAMVQEDVRWFFQMLPLCRQVKVILFAGTVRSRVYMNRFVAKIARVHGFDLRGRPVSRGRAPVDFHTLVGGGRKLPVFFCGVSPSAPDPSGLIERVQEHRAVLAEWTRGQL